jgi:hypothetical protein
MKKKLKHSSAQRLYWKNAQRRWRSKHRERAKEIRREYWRKKRLRMTPEKEQKQMKARASREIERTNRRARMEAGK